MVKKIQAPSVPVSKYAAKKAANAKANVENIAEETVVEKKEFKPKKFIRSKSPAIDRYPEHVTNLVLIIKNNAEIRRFTSLGIINRLTQKGIINGEKKYVTYKWNKFTVYCDGLGREFSYSETFFLNSLVAAFSSFSSAAQRTINTFCSKEINQSLDGAVSSEEVEDIVKENENHVNDKDESVVE